MKRAIKTYYFLLALIGVSILLNPGCEREPATDYPLTGDEAALTFQTNVIKLDTMIFTNPVLINGQVRFDLIGTPPAIKTGDMVYYSNGNRFFGEVLSLTEVGPRLVFQIKKVGLDRIFSSLNVRDTLSQYLLKSRTRTDVAVWNADTLHLADLQLYNDTWQSESLLVKFTSGKFHSNSSVKQFSITGMGKNPWFDRCLLDFRYSCKISAEMVINAGGALEATDSLLLETKEYGPFMVGGFPLTYQIDTWIGFHAKTAQDTVISLKLDGYADGDLSMNYNYWETCKFTQKSIRQSAEIQHFSGPSFSGYLGEMFICQVITPRFCGEVSFSLMNEFSATVLSEVNLPNWQATQTIATSGILLKTGSAIDEIPAGQTTDRALLYSETQNGVLENQPPKASFTIDPQAGYTDTNFKFDASNSSDIESPQESLQFRWDFDGDNHFDTEFSGDMLVYHKYPQPGTYLPVLEVKDPAGLTSRKALSIEVSLSSSAPVAHFTVNPESGRISDVFIFDAYGCYDAEDLNSQLKVRWDFNGDGIWDTNWSTRKIEYNVYREEGKFVAKLEVLDTQGLTGSTTRIVNVAPVNIKPTAFFTVDPEKGTSETLFTFDASGSTDPEDSTQYLEVRWDWENDGTFDTDYRTIKTIQHAFPAPGLYTVVLEVIDTEGYGATYSKEVTVLNPNTAPYADFSIIPVSGHIGDTITFDASISTDAEDSVDLLQVRWDWNNDNIYDTEFTTEKIFPKVFSVTGNFIIKVQVKDTGGLTDTRAKLLVID